MLPSPAAGFRSPSGAVALPLWLSVAICWVCFKHEGVQNRLHHCPLCWCATGSVSIPSSGSFDFNIALPSLRPLEAASVAESAQWGVAQHVKLEHGLDSYTSQSVMWRGQHIGLFIHVSSPTKEALSAKL